MIINSLILTSVKWLWMRKLVKLKMAWSSNWIRRMKTLQTVKTNQLTKKCNLWLNQERENAEKSISARTQTDSTMPRTCATTATTARERARWPMLAAISIDPTTPEVCVRTAICLSTIFKEKTRNLRSLLTKKPKLIKRPLKLTWSIRMSLKTSFRIKLPKSILKKTSECNPIRVPYKLVKQFKRSIFFDTWPTIISNGHGPSSKHSKE